MITKKVSNPLLPRLRLHDCYIARMTRGTLSKTVRFSVFKRDSFACRYCGATAPNVQLHVDHVVPVSEGGQDDIDNLVTACAACNFGKGARNLGEGELAALKESGPEEMDEAVGDDLAADARAPIDPVVYEDIASGGIAGFASRSEQTRAIEERRAQLEMVIEWREEIVGLQDEAVDALDRRIVARTGLSMDEEYRQRMRRWVRHYGLAVVFEALEDAFDQMLEWRDGVVLLASWERAFASIPQVVELRQVARDKPYFREFIYICGLLRRRLPYLNELRCLRLMEDGLGAGASIEAMKAFARTVKSWTAFRKGLEEFINDYGRSGHVLAGASFETGEGHGAGPGQDTDTDDRAAPAGPVVDRREPAPSSLAEPPFDKRRPLRHFSTGGTFDEAGRGDREIAGTGDRYRPS
jgi:hypothetical protein